MPDELPEPAPTKFRLPPKIKLPQLDNDYEVELRIYGIVDDGVERAKPALNNLLSKLDDKAFDRIEAAAQENDRDVPDFIRDKINTLSLAYVGYRTGEARIQEEDTGANVTRGYLPMILGELSEVMGESVTMELYRTLTSNLDTVLNEHCGIGR